MIDLFMNQSIIQASSCCTNRV